MGIIAAISGSSLVNLLITVLIFAVIFWLIDWAIKAIPIPSPFSTVARVILILAAVIFLINSLLRLAS